MTTAMTMNNQKLLNRAKAIRLLLLDVDGVLTDGSLYYGNNGEELKAFNMVLALNFYSATASKWASSLVAHRHF